MCLVLNAKIYNMLSKSVWVLILPKRAHVISYPASRFYQSSSNQLQTCCRPAGKQELTSARPENRTKKKEYICSSECQADVDEASNTNVDIRPENRVWPQVIAEKGLQAHPTGIEY